MLFVIFTNGLKLWHILSGINLVIVVVHFYVVFVL